jgi:shikimate kinase
MSRRRNFAPSSGLDRTVVLIGLMGSGKSTIGRRLAVRLGVGYIDADAEIEEAAGCSIEDIFTFHGEEAFRDGERRVIKRLLDGPVHVLAAGGGSFMDAQTRATMAKRSTTVWLRAELDVLVRRVRRTNSRPLLRDGDPHEILSRLIEEREPVYAQAALTIDSGDGAADDVVDDIISKLHDLRAKEAADETPHPDP